MVIPDELFPSNHRQRILIIGAGATGSAVAKELADIDATCKNLGYPGLELHIYDDRKVQPHHPGKQLYFPSDVGRYKSEVIAERIRFNYAEFDTLAFGYPERILADNNGNNSYRTSPADIVIMCVDTTKSRREIYSSLHSVCIIDSGNGKDFGQILIGMTKTKQPEISQETVDEIVMPHLRNMALIEYKEEDDSASCSSYESLSKQSLFINRALAVMIGNLIMTMIETRMVFYKGIYLNLTTMQMVAEEL